MRKKNRGTHGVSSLMLCPTGQSTEKPPLQTQLSGGSMSRCSNILTEEKASRLKRPDIPHTAARGNPHTGQSVTGCL